MPSVHVQGLSFPFTPLPRSIEEKEGKTLTQSRNDAERAMQYAAILKCPVCGGRFQAAGPRSLECFQRHTFDFAKQGYLNLMSHPVHSHYDKELFAARRSIIAESKLYAPMHETIARVIHAYAGAPASAPRVADMGCGEGSHLQGILRQLNSPEGLGVGIDLSKEAIRLAARQEANALWIVSDLAHAPLQDQSVQVVLNLMSPANYGEFQRMVAPGGVVVKVVPGADYLRELRASLYDGHEKRIYSNEKTVMLFRRHFPVMEVTPLKYRQQLRAEQLRDLVRMSPLAWSAEQKRITAFTQREATEITIDVEILVGHPGGPLDGYSATRYHE